MMQQNSCVREQGGKLPSGAMGDEETTASPHNKDVPLPDVHFRHRQEKEEEESASWRFHGTSTASSDSEYDRPLRKFYTRRRPHRRISLDSVQPSNSADLILNSVQAWPHEQCLQDDFRQTESVESKQVLPSACQILNSVEAWRNEQCIQDDFRQRDSVESKQVLSSTHQILNSVEAWQNEKHIQDDFRQRESLESKQLLPSTHQILNSVEGWQNEQHIQDDFRQRESVESKQVLSSTHQILNSVEVRQNEQHIQGDFRQRQSVESKQVLSSTHQILNSVEVWQNEQHIQDDFRQRESFESKQVLPSTYQIFNSVEGWQNEKHIQDNFRQREPVESMQVLPCRNKGLNPSTGWQINRHEPLVSGNNSTNVEMGQSVMIVDERINDDKHLEHSSNSMDDSLKITQVASAHNVCLSETSFTLRAKEKRHWTSQEFLEPKHAESREANLGSRMSELSNKDFSIDVKMSQSVMVADERINDNSHPEHASIFANNSSKEARKASIHDVHISEASLTLRGMGRPHSASQDSEIKQAESTEANLGSTEARIEQQKQVITTFQKGELKLNSFPARKKRKMQKINELPCPKTEKLLTKRGDGNLTNGCQQAKDLRNLSLNPSSEYRKWRCVNVAAADPTSLVGRRCKVYWPLESSWFSGVITSYDDLKARHHVDYDDGDNEDLILADESIQMFLSLDEMIALNLQFDEIAEGRKSMNVEEMGTTTPRNEDFQEIFELGEVVWAKMKGHPMWPALVVDEKHADKHGLTGEGFVVQFFGSYDFARISPKHAFSFSQGLLQKFQLKCKRTAFEKSFEEAERYLKEQKLPEGMENMQDEAVDFVPEEDEGDEKEGMEEEKDLVGDEEMHKVQKGVRSPFCYPIKLGSLRVLNLGEIVKDSDHFHNEHHIWPEGYTAIRRFISIIDPRKSVDYKMGVLRNPSVRSMPLFRVTPSDSAQVEGPTPSACWRKIFKKLDKAKKKYGITHTQRQNYKSGAYMFGLSIRRIHLFIQALPNVNLCFKFRGWHDKLREKSQDLLPPGCEPVKIDWKHSDRCNVCYLDEEYVNNLFLQCDKCRMLVHMHCYGELEMPDGHLWLCKLCRPGHPVKVPPCALCPVEGGAMKETTDGRWAHLTCALWIPETCLVDIRRMEPIDGISSINKERWKLTCSICRVAYGVCIQCSEFSCCVAYHILCARSAGLVTEVLEDFSSKDKTIGEDHERPVRLLSYCKKHRQLKSEHHSKGPHLEGSHSNDQDCTIHYPRQSSAGCARCEPFDSAARRGRQEPEALAAAAAKRLYVEKMPFLVGGFHRKGYAISVTKHVQGTSGEGETYINLPNMKAGESSTDESSRSLIEDIIGILSMSERYQHMRNTLTQRLTFGKSGIHGWGIFAKKKHLAGDMIIEYAGEIVRPIVADIRERVSYNSLVGAGTYMFRIDDERVVDATRAGSIAHLINHACEPNCYSRVITVSGKEHIIIFAKRDIQQYEELAYDYRFTSKGEKLACYCGFPSCRGSVNAHDTDEEHTRICVSRCDLTKWVPMT